MGELYPSYGCGVEPAEWGCEHGSVPEQTPQSGPLTDLGAEELSALRDEQQAAYDALCERGLTLDLTRGKPSPAQLDLSDRLLTLPDRTRPCWRRRAQLRRPGGHPRDPRDVRRPPVG